MAVTSFPFVMLFLVLSLNVGSRRLHSPWCLQQRTCAPPHRGPISSSSRSWCAALRAAVSARLYVGLGFHSRLLLSVVMLFVVLNLYPGRPRLVAALVPAFTLVLVFMAFLLSLSDVVRRAQS
jgi:hypothetical protein